VDMEFYRIYQIFQKGLNRFKIHGRFKFEYIPEFITCNPLGFWTWYENWSCSLCSNMWTYKSWRNLHIWKDTNSNINVWVFKNLDKSKKCRGPLVSLRRRLNGTQSLASCTCTSCLAMRWWPKLHHGRQHVLLRVSLSSVRLGSEAKPNFFTSPLPSPLHGSRHVLSALLPPSASVPSIEHRY
jgi:hypothetical protein